MRGNEVVCFHVAIHGIEKMIELQTAKEPIRGLGNQIHIQRAAYTPKSADRVHNLKQITRI
jgi:hypothetical protein